MSDDGGVSELLVFLRDARLAVRKGALEAVLGLTASTDGRTFLRGGPIVDELRRLLGSFGDGVAGLAVKALVNLSEDVELQSQMSTLVPTLMELLRDDDCNFKREIVMLLANLSQSTDTCERVLQLQSSGGSEGGMPMGLYFRLLIQWFLAPLRSDGLDTFEYVALLLQNLTQVPAARHILLEPERGILPPLLRQLSSPQVIRRRGVSAVIRNLCFETSESAIVYLLSPAVDVITTLLLPLAGADRYLAEEKVGMPAALYKGALKQRESDPATRRHLLEALVLLAASRPARERMRSCRCVEE